MVRLYLPALIDCEGKFLHEVEENAVPVRERVMNTMQMWRNDSKSQLFVEIIRLREHDALIASKNSLMSAGRQQ